MSATLPAPATPKAWSCRFSRVVCTLADFSRSGTHQKPWAPSDHRFAAPTRSGPSRPHRPGCKARTSGPTHQTCGAGLAPRPRVVSRRPATGRLRKPWALSAPVLWISGNTGLHASGITEAQVFNMLYHRKTVNPYQWNSALTGMRASGDLRACAGHPAQDPSPPPQTRPP